MYIYIYISMYIYIYTQPIYWMDEHLIIDIYRTPIYSVG